MMQIEAIGLSPELSQVDLEQTTPVNRFESYLQSVNDQLIVADNMVEGYLTGEEISVQQVMMELSSAKSKMQMVVETRNRLLEGFNEVMRMQI